MKHQYYRWFRGLLIFIWAGLFGLLAYITLPSPSVLAQNLVCPWESHAPPLGSEVFTLTGTISDHLGHPASCVQVFAFSGIGSFSTNTDENGEFSLVVANREYDVVFNPIPMSGGPASDVRRGVDDPEDLTPIIELPAGNLISGRILSDIGEPLDLGDQGVSIFASNQETFSGFGLPGTSPTGTFQISLASGPWELTFTPPNFKGLAPVAITMTITEDITRDIFLASGFTLHGKVLSGNLGIPNVEIFALDTSSKEKGQKKEFGFSPSRLDGGYYGTLPEGVYDVSFLAPPDMGFGSVVELGIEGPPNSGSPEIFRQIDLAVGYTIFGTVNCRFGQPNFFVHAAPEQPIAGIIGGWGTFTGAGGAYALALQPGRYDLEVSAPENSELRPLKIETITITENMPVNFTYPCVEGLTYARILNEKGEPLPDAKVFHNGTLAIDDLSGDTFVDVNGNLVLEHVQLNDKIIGLAPVHIEPSFRDHHDQWAYRIYNTTAPLDPEGNMHPFTVISNTGPQTLTIQSQNTLILFNIVVSIEWDATEAYISGIEEAFRNASDYLYDVTDGQMAFEKVLIYDNAEHWEDADFQFSTKNTVRPYAYIGGITSKDTGQAIRVGRFWNRYGSGENATWNQPDGYRTLIHEFGHYALYLEDEYFARGKDEDGNLQADKNVACTDPLIRKSSSGDATNASIMYWHYNASELAGADRWNENCQATEQHRINGKSDWETIIDRYQGDTWTLHTPSSRDNIMAGPETFPRTLLPFPEIISHNSGNADRDPININIQSDQSAPIHNALVALYTKNPAGVTVAIDQGVTDSQGRIKIFGARFGDFVQATTFDGALSGRIEIDDRTDYQFPLFPSGVRKAIAIASSGVDTSYLSLIPSSDGNTFTIELFGPNGIGNLFGIVIPDKVGSTPRFTHLAYNADETTYEGHVEFTGGEEGSGQVQINGVVDGQLILINSDYTLQQVQAITPNILYAQDGNFEFHIPAEGILADLYAATLPTGYVPGPLPKDLSVIGNAYSVRLSGALAELEKDGMVRLHYHPNVLGHYKNIAIYFWDANLGWQNIGGEASEVDNAWSIATRRLGIYALLGEPAYTIYLPIIIK